MLIFNSHKSKQFLDALIKLCIVIGAIYFIGYKLTSNDDLEFHQFLSHLKNNKFFSTENVVLLILLSLINWFLEILKWKTLVSSVSPISYNNSLEQSLGALTASLLTPNRIGEYGAKAFYYPKALRKKIILLNLIGNMMQMTTTLFFGTIGIFFFVHLYSLKLNLLKLFLLVTIALLFILAVIYILNKNKFKIKGFSFASIMAFIKGISVEVKIKALILSILRYLIFSLQFYCLLQIFDIQITYSIAMMMITTMYLLSSIVPSIFIFDVVIKGSVAVYLFSIIGVNELTILCIVTLMWLLNFVIPSVFGSYYVLNFNFPKVEDTL